MMHFFLSIHPWFQIRENKSFIPNYNIIAGRLYSMWDKSQWKKLPARERNDCPLKASNEEYPVESKPMKTVEPILHIGLRVGGILRQSIWGKSSGCRGIAPVTWVR